MRVRPTGPAACDEERLLEHAGYCAVAGLDEAGRGAWAGPLVAAAVVLPQPVTRASELLQGVRDSKQLTSDQRERLFDLIQRTARAVGVGIVRSSDVDRLGLGPAGRLAFAEAVNSLAARPDYLLIDAFRVPEVPLPQKPIIFGDCLSLSIASASIVAKVVRDRMMRELDQAHPGYGFGRHKGYGTRLHQQSLAERGPCAEHRMSYSPLRNLRVENLSLEFSDGD
jgi:ribonuclease HII